MKRFRRLLLTTIGLAWTVSTAGAYYHFVHYTSRFAPYNAIQEKLDLSALPNKTITFFVSDAAVSQVSRSDLMPSVLSSIREAARVWNNVDTSDLRVTFGGFSSAGTTQNTPGADIVFEEMDPLLLGLTSTNASSSPAFVSGAQFAPITRPVVRINRNLGAWTTASSGPSFTEAFFLTVVHEMGHALGLQHTFTASVMSTEITRASSLYTPLTADDIAGLSYLYPSPSFGRNTGSISGRISFSSGQGVHLASVVAVRPTGGALSALTDPDGRYRIDGLPPGTYYLYVHPLPPAPRSGTTPGDLALPVDADGRPLAGDAPFDTLFYQGDGSPGTRDYRQAHTVDINAGSQLDSISFMTNRRSSYGPITSVTTYSYYDQTPVRPGYLTGNGTLVAVGAGLVTSSGALAPGLSVNFLGGTPVLLPSGGMLAYFGSLVVYLNLPSTFGSTGQRAMIFSTPDDIYILPSALNLVQSRPPFISSVTPVSESSGVSALALSGTTLSSDTRFYFDGAPAKILRFDDAGRAIVAPPPGLAGTRATITAFNPDGQNSMFLQASAAPAYSYETGDAGVMTVSPATLAAGGAESLIEITGSAGNFVEGTTSVGLGSSDVQVRRMWVVSPNRILANVWVSASAGTASITASVMTGFQVISQPFALQIVPANSKAPVLNPLLVNAAPPSTGAFPGAKVTLSGANLSDGTLTIGDRALTIFSSSSTQITFLVPPDLSTGPAILKFSNGVDTASVAIVIDSFPPDVRGITTLADVIVDINRPARAGDILNVLVSNLADAGVTPDSSRVRVTIGGVDHPILAVTPVSQGHHLRIAVGPSVAAGLALLTVSIDGRSSLPYSLAINR